MGGVRAWTEYSQCVPRLEGEGTRDLRPQLACTIGPLGSTGGPCLRCGKEQDFLEKTPWFLGG